jgi:hypothetical protein
MAQCIFGHVGSISRDFVDLNRALPNLHGMPFVFSHSLGRVLPVGGRRPAICRFGPVHCRRPVARASRDFRFDTNEIQSPVMYRRRDRQSLGQGSIPIRAMQHPLGSPRLFCRRHATNRYDRFPNCPRR